jgi:hypothetical protein
MKVDKEKFDAVLGRLMDAKPEKRSEITPKRKKLKTARKSSARGARKA